MRSRVSPKTLTDRCSVDVDYADNASRDRPDAAATSLDMSNGLIETEYLLRSPANAAHLATSIAQFRLGMVGRSECG
jgi:antitoxin YefM